MPNPIWRPIYQSVCWVVQLVTRWKQVSDSTPVRWSDGPVSPPASPAPGDARAGALHRVGWSGRMEAASLQNGEDNCEQFEELDHQNSSKNW